MSERSGWLRVAVAALALAISGGARAGNVPARQRPRARDVGIVVGIFAPGPLNAITDVDGVRVGQTSLIEGRDVRTGVTAVLPHPGDLYHERVPGAIVTANGFGKLLGATQVRELGEIETPILLTCTLCVWTAANAMVDWLLAKPGMEDVVSVNPVVAETNDGTLNDIRARPLRPEHVVGALTSARGGPVQEGSVGAGTGTIAFGWKAGIGTSSRRLPATLSGYTVGVLVQSNFGGVLTIHGAPVGQELGRYAFRWALEPAAERVPDDDGSIIIVVATDAPLSARNLERLARRALLGLGRTGADMANGSGDYVVAFSTAPSVRRRAADGPRGIQDLPNYQMSSLFEAVIEATEEAIYDSLFRATSMTGYRGRAEALPLERVLPILDRYGARSVEIDRQ